MSKLRRTSKVPFERVLNALLRVDRTADDEAVLREVGFNAGRESHKDKILQARAARGAL